jgi:hypothetical protein
MISERDAGSYLAYSRDKAHPPKSGGVIARDPQTLGVSAPPGAYEGRDALRASTDRERDIAPHGDSDPAAVAKMLERKAGALARATACGIRSQAHPSVHTKHAARSSPAPLTLTGSVIYFQY